jgi:5-methylthioadenosine/S-adenosylhomocysteine deaminase
MRTAALVAKAASGNASAVGAQDALEMATLESARALGLESEVGSIEAGKSADLAAIELESPETLPLYNPISQLVYAAGREHVTHVWVAGEPRVADRRLIGIDADELAAKARWWQERLAS